MATSLEKDYFHEQGLSPDISMPQLADGHIITAEEARSLEELAYDDDGLQIVAGVASYTFIRRDPDNPKEYQVWVGARREEDPIHPNVFSTPTYRIPVPYIGSLLVGKTVAKTTGESLHFSSNWTNMKNKDRPEVDRADQVLYGKLGGSFDYDRMDTHVSLASIRYGVSSVYGWLAANKQDRDLEEAIFMLNLLVHLGDNTSNSLIGEDLSEYPISMWVSPNVLSESWKTKDVGELIPDGEKLTEAELCIHGICIVSSVIDHQSGIQAAHLEALERSFQIPR